MWETVAGSAAERPDNDGVRAQMASLAQQIIDALPDRIKQESFLEEEYEGSEQPVQQQFQDCFQDGSDMAYGMQQHPVPQVNVASASANPGDFASYR